MTPSPMPAPEGGDPAGPLPVRTEDVDADAGFLLVVPPRVELALLPGLFVFCWAFASTTFGELLSSLPRLQFHELGHALAAWWTGRRALPLPIGFTAWSEERSTLLVGMQGLFVALLAIHGVRERKPLPVAIAAALGVALGIGLTTPLAISEGWVIAAGQIGETLLPGVFVAAFHLRLPHRVRWDFWRWLVVLLALFALASAVRTGWQIAAGERPLPWGALLGNESDGDLNRLVAEHGWTAAGLRRMFGVLPGLALTVAFGTHFAIGGLRVWREHASRRQET